MLWCIETYLLIWKLWKIDCSKSSHFCSIVQKLDDLISKNKIIMIKIRRHMTSSRIYICFILGFDSPDLTKSYICIVWIFRKNKWDCIISVNIKDNTNNRLVNKFFIIQLIYPSHMEVLFHERNVRYYYKEVLFLRKTWVYLWNFVF